MDRDKLRIGIAFKVKGSLAPQFREEIVAFRAMVDAGESECAEREVSEALVRSTIVAGNAAQVWSDIAVVSWPRDREHILNLLHTLAATRSPASAAVRT